MKPALFAAAALAPLSLVLAGPSLAQTTTITDSRTTPVQTSTAAGGQPSNVVINSGVVIGPAAPNTVGVTIDSSNTVANAGNITFNDASDVTGLLIRGGFTGGYTQTGAINILEAYTPTDADSDGDLDGVFAQAARRYGIRVAGPGVFTGSIAVAAGGLISVEGVDSFGVSVESALAGSFTSQGTLGVLGDRSRAFSNTAAISGSINLLGTVAAQGAGSQAVFVGAPVGGGLVLQGTLRATGYRNTTRPALPSARASLDADDLLQGGAAVRVAADIARGILVDTTPADLIPTDTDEDDDGIEDLQEPSGVIQSFGSAPAIDIGAESAAVRVGAVGTGASAYGLVVRGNVIADGIYDGVAATAVRVGQTNAGAGATTLENGMAVAAGAGVGANAYLANATAVQVNAGGSATTILNNGEIGGQVSGDTNARATAIEINAGGTVNTLRNDGTLSAQIIGEQGAAATVVDRSGTLNLIENRGLVVALITPTDDSLDTDDPNSDPSDEIVTGSRTAFDLRANTSGVTLRQSGRANDGDTDTADGDGDGVDDLDEPSIIGDILLGSGDDVVDALNGAIIGDIAFGAGADRLTVAGGAQVQGAVTDADGRLSVDVQNGSLTLTNTATVNVTSVNVAAGGAISFSADPGAGTVGRVTASGAVTVANGAQVGLRLASLQRGSAEYAVLSGSTLNVGSLNSLLLGQTPFLYVITPRVDAASNTLLIGVRPRTAVELEFNRSETEAFAAVFDALDLNPRIESAVLGQTTQEGLVRLYDQLLPDHSGGAVLSLSAVNDAISNVLSSRTEPRGRVGPNGAWAQEIFFNLRQDRDQAQGAESQGFGITGGFEGLGADGGALGLTASFVTADFEDTNAVAGEQVSFSMFEIGAYLRRQYRGVRFDARAAGGVVLFDSDRRFVSATDNLALISEADWTGYSASGHFGVSYEYGDRVYVRPYASLDAIYLREGDYAESGGGTGFDLEVDSRSSTLVSAAGGLTAGARFGRETWFGPELTVGYRSRIAGEPGTTTARFRNGSGTPFRLSAEDAAGGGLQIRFALRTGSHRGYLALETGGEIDGDYERYDIRLVAKVFF